PTALARAARDAASVLAGTASGRRGGRGVRAESAGELAGRARRHDPAGGRAAAEGSRTGVPVVHEAPVLRCAARSETDSPGARAAGASGLRAPHVGTVGAIRRRGCAKSRRTDKSG